MRTMIGLSLGVLIVLGSTAACSSDKVDGESKGGTGTVLTAGSGGTGSTTGGSAANNGGTTAGTSTTGGTSADPCAGKSVSCIDAMTAQGCDPDTGMDITGNCAEEFAKDGIVSDGCSTDAEGTGCTVDGFSDMACLDGTGPFAACEDVTDADLINVYVACFRDVQGLHAIIPCFADHVDETTMPPTVDCDAAYAACAPSAPMGEGGAPMMGAGGAPDGAGGAP